jgi:hypothetical protein
MRLPRNVSATAPDDRAVGSSAHARIGDLHHVADPLFDQFAGGSQIQRLGHAVIVNARQELRLFDCEKAVLEDQRCRSAIATVTRSSETIALAE